VDYGTVFAYGFGLLLLYLLIRLLFVPLRFFVLLLYNGVVGGLMVWILDLVGKYIDVHVSLNPITALTAGFLGLPGLGLLVALTKVLE